MTSACFQLLLMRPWEHSMSWQALFWLKLSPKSVLNEGKATLVNAPRFILTRAITPKQNKAYQGMLTIAVAACSHYRHDAQFSS